jgi:hypothetical protein
LNLFTDALCTGFLASGWCAADAATSFASTWEGTLDWPKRLD